MELYVHFPFCAKKCRYCDFVSFPHMEDRMDAYVDALLREAELRAPEVTEPVRTVYFGGGTPSLLPPDTMARCIRGLRERIPLDQAEEWTVEANPGALSSGFLSVCLEGGMTRLSLGMQAAQPRLLSLLGRIHSPGEVFSSVRLAFAAGVSHLNLDLIFGIPTQRPEQWRETLEAALSMSPEHLSAYGLIPEAHTPLWEDLETGRLRLPEPEEERDMYDTAINLLARHGLRQYEISNFSREGCASRHNIGYWDQVPYLGLGLSASSMVFREAGAGGMRYLRKTNTFSMADYFRGIREGHPVLSENEWISPAEARFETMMLGLRMNRGVPEEEFLRRHGVSLDSCYGERLRKLERSGLVVFREGSWRLTRRGMDLQNTVLVDLMEED